MNKYLHQHFIYIRKSWQARLLNSLLRLFVKRFFSRAALETSLEALSETILNFRKKGDSFSIRLPSHAIVENADLNGIKGKWITTSTYPKKVIFYLHGGAYVMGSSNTYLDLGYRLAKVCEAKVLIIDYRLSPDHSFSDALEDALSAYKALIQMYSPSDIIIAGDSAGGGLALSTLIALRDKSFPLPIAGVCLSPWTDLALTGESLIKNAKHDPYVVIPKELIFLGKIDPYDPLVSPLYAELHNLPPLLIQVSNIEVLLDDAQRFAEKASQAGSSIRLEIWKDMPHVWQYFAKFLPEGKKAIQYIANFINETTK